MKKPRDGTTRDATNDAEYEDWRARYNAAIAAYEERTGRRYERMLAKRAQARRDRTLRIADEDEWRWIETHPSHDPIERYFRHRMAAGVLALWFLSWTVSSVATVFMASAAAATLRRLATETINHVERLLWRTKRKIESPAGVRSAAARERRKIRRRSTRAPKPSPDDIRKAWLKANDSCRDIIAFGARIHDLECYVDNALVFDEYGNIVGRAAGILGWLREEIPELAVRYKTIMRYKSIAKRCRQFLGLVDPEPLDPEDRRLVRLLADCPATQKDVRERLDAALARLDAKTARHDGRRGGPSMRFNA